jgi:predicted Zn-dependent protease
VDPAGYYREGEMSKKTTVILLLAFIVVSCAVNPVTGKKELMLYSESQEIELGKQTDTEVAATYGVYDDAALSAYVSKLGLALAAKTQRPNLPYRFTVLDSSVVNAFAVPGGAVYVTRGILAMMSSEAELAAVLGHELGHVNARHSMSQMSKQQMAQIGLVVGSVISQKFAKYAGLAGAGLQVLFLKYSRDNENQADALGVDYSRAGGYNPADMTVTFTALEKMGDLSGGHSLPGFLSTHPLTPDRITHVQAMLKPEDASLARKPEAYLRTVENVVYGDDPRQGFVEGSAFYHPGLRFEFTVPSGWKVDNTPARVTLVSGDQDGGLILQAEKNSDNLEDYARKKAAEISGSGGQLQGEKRTTINGLSCIEQAYTLTQENQAPIRMRWSYLRKGELVYLFLALSSVEGFPKYEPVFRRVVGSFREMTNTSLINRTPKRLALVTANGSDSLEGIFKKAGLTESAWPHFAIMNGLDLKAVPPARKLVKVVK